MGPNSLANNSGISTKGSGSNRGSPRWDPRRTDKLRSPIRFSSKVLKRESNAKNTWASELPNVPWAYQTTPPTTTGESPFNLVFSVEAIIPVEIAIPSLRVEGYNERLNDELMRSSLDLVEETREKARIRVAAYQQRVARYYNHWMKERALKEGDLVLRRAEVSDPRNAEKLALSWEGPFRVIRILRPGAYKIENLDGTLIPGT
ncbi:uncharacterized protein LOC143869805 [Tasmannia lanceolata]|uniref:uncharacterized protein LOC143869805 n=1 Tax=Tasmannia lanceolata TaxID=3420 RepID=UPI0040635519